MHSISISITYKSGQRLPTVQTKRAWISRQSAFFQARRETSTSLKLLFLDKKHVTLQEHATSDHTVHGDHDARDHRCSCYSHDPRHGEAERRVQTENSHYNIQDDSRGG